MAFAATLRAWAMRAFNNDRFSAGGHGHRWRGRFAAVLREVGFKYFVQYSGIVLER
jgi:hypothetical protein